MSASTRQVVPAQRIPAWKRLGLKVKGPAVGGSPASVSPASHAAPSAQHSEPAAARVNGPGAGISWNKRKENLSSDHSGSGLNASKKARIETASPSILRKQKSVTFADDTKSPEATPPANPQINGETRRQSQAKKKKKNKTKSGKTKPAATKEAEPSLKAPNLEPSLIYLRQWQTARGLWKFNKNHQTLLVKYLFDCGPESPSGFHLPSTDIDTFYDYIREMVGDVRSRLRSSAEDLRKADMAIKESEASKEGEVKEPEKTQAEYDQIVSEMLQQRDNMASGLNGNGKRTRRISEVEYVMRVADPDVQRRLVKRIRAENILDELSDSDASITSTGIATTTTTGPSSQDAPDGDAEKKVKLNDGSQQNIKRKRKRKSRDAMLGDDTSSSESESGDDETSSAGSSSSGSSSESSDDEEMPLPPGQADVETSSSSSSSSSGGESEGEFESGEDESGEGDEEESDSDEEL